MEVILDAAERFSERKDVKFIIIGNGVCSTNLQQIANTRGLTNVIFKPLQSHEILPQVLAMADVHLVVQKRGAADAVLPSKLTNILDLD